MLTFMMFTLLKMRTVILTGQHQLQGGKKMKNSFNAQNECRVCKHGVRFFNLYLCELKSNEIETFIRSNFMKECISFEKKPMKRNQE